MNIDPNMIIFYVNNLNISRDFYKNLLGIEPMDKEDKFTIFPLKSGLRLGLWAKEAVKPGVTKHDNSEVTGELSFQVAEDEEIDHLYTKWSNKNVTIIQAPSMLDFGYTFVGLDPDNNRLRVFSLKQPN